MEALIIVAHGSRVENSNKEIVDFCKELKTSNSRYELITYSFLEFAEPNLEQSVKECIEKGVYKIRVFPYFLAAGKHVIRDIPNEVTILKERFKMVEIELLTHLGRQKGLEEIILNA